MIETYTIPADLVWIVFGVLIFLTGLLGGCIPKAWDKPITGIPLFLAMLIGTVAFGMGLVHAVAVGIGMPLADNWVASSLLTPEAGGLTLEP